MVSGNCLFKISRFIWLSCACVAATLTAQEYDPPAGYYASADGLLGEALRVELHDIIDGHINLTYDAMRQAPRILDVDPDNPDNILLIYSGLSVPGYRFNSDWNREHTWPQSYGADSSLKPGADFHHLFPCDPGVNSSRSNSIFDWTNPNDYNEVQNAPGSSRDSNSFEPRDEDKGRVARAMMYMDLRYENGDGYGDFTLAESSNQSSKRMAKLSTLLEWNRLFPPNEAEFRRNHLIHNGFNFVTFFYKQGNRNPFIDYPDLADAIFLDGAYNTWGSWRWENFSLTDYAEGTNMGPFDDPDGDMLVNLIEFSANLDPSIPLASNLLTKSRFPGFAIQLRYNRQKNPQQSGLTYSIENSLTPLREETWTGFAPGEVSSTSVSDSGETETVTVNLPDLGSDKFFRLKVTQTLGDDSLEATFDPISTYDPTGSIFVYDSLISGSPWKTSTWLGQVYDVEFPWTYHSGHGWIFMDASRDDAVWIGDPAIGWFFTSADYYPFIYHVGTDQWLFYYTDSHSPNRLFMNFSNNWLSESSLIPNN